MRADIGGRSLTVTHLPRRHARGRLFTASGRGLVILAIATGVALAALGALIERAQPAVSPIPSPAWSGR